MQFPFIAPFKSWVKQKLEHRESNTNLSAFVSPWIMLTSFSIVAKLNGKNEEPTTVDITSKAGSAQVKYNGCIISSTTDIKKQYQTGATIVGYDLDGKEIVVENEENRKISLPIIQKMEIDTDNGNNTLKTAKIDIKLFTLKQLEMFELFFLRPGTNIMLEFGNNVDITNDRYGIDNLKRKVQKELFINKHSNYEQASKAFADFYNMEDNKFLTYRDKYLQILQDTQGNYDYWPAKVTNFSYSIDADGTYNVQLDVSAGNELQLWMPIKQSEKKNNVKSGTTNVNTKPIETWLYKIAADLNLDAINNRYSKNIKELEPHFFNWQFINQKQSDTKYSNVPYVSMEFVLMLLNDMQIYKTSSQKIKSTYLNGTENVIPINSNPCIMSTSEDIILPGLIPNIKVVPDTNGTIIVIDEEEKTINDKNNKPQKVKQIKYNDYKINGKSFNLTDSEKRTLSNTIFKAYPGEIKGTIGNLLNIFINYEAVLGAYQTSSTQADFINTILNTINTHMFGLCDLQISMDADTAHSTLTIIDYKLRTDITRSDPPSYRFNLSPSMNWQDKQNPKYTKKSSIIKDFNFNYEMGVLMQAQAMYQTQLSLNAAKQGNKQTNNPSKTIISRENFDYVYSVNADGYYAINEIEYLINKMAEPFNKDNEIKGLTKAKTKTEADKEKKNQIDVLKDRSIKFKWTSADKKKSTNEATLIYLDSALIQNKIDVAPPDTTSLTFLEIKITIDGMSGLSCGEYFNIDGIPEIYNKNGFFQITNVKHSIDPESGWMTHIEAGLRIKNYK
jgi:hypothetical protein